MQGQQEQQVEDDHDQQAPPCQEPLLVPHLPEVVGLDVISEEAAVAVLVAAAPHLAGVAGAARRYALLARSSWLPVHLHLRDLDGHQLAATPGTRAFAAVEGLTYTSDASSTPEALPAAAAAMKHAALHWGNSSSNSSSSSSSSSSSGKIATIGGSLSSSHDTTSSSSSSSGKIATIDSSLSSGHDTTSGSSSSRPVSGSAVTTGRRSRGCGLSRVCLHLLPPQHLRQSNSSRGQLLQDIQAAGGKPRQWHHHVTCDTRCLVTSLSHLPHLQHLELYVPELSASHLHLLAGLSRLTQLQLCCSSCRTDSEVQVGTRVGGSSLTAPLAALTGLRSLAVAGIHLETATGHLFRLPEQQQQQQQEEEEASKEAAQATTAASQAAGVAAHSPPTAAAAAASVVAPPSAPAVPAGLQQLQLFINDHSYRWLTAVGAACPQLSSLCLTWTGGQTLDFYAHPGALLQDHIQVLSKLRQLRLERLPGSLKFDLLDIREARGYGLYDYRHQMGEQIELNDSLRELTQLQQLQQLEIVGWQLRAATPRHWGLLAGLSSMSQLAAEVAGDNPSELGPQHSSVLVPLGLQLPPEDALGPGSNLLRNWPRPG